MAYGGCLTSQRVDTFAINEIKQVAVALPFEPYVLQVWPNC